MSEGTLMLLALTNTAMAEVRLDVLESQGVFVPHILGYENLSYTPC